MKLGPVEVKFSRTGGSVELAEKPRLGLGELGATGTQIFGGLMQQQDYNADLHTSLRYAVYDKMRRADGQVRAGLAVIKLPLLRAKWSIKPASPSTQDREIAEFLSDNLFGAMSFPWLKTLRQVLLCLDYGNMPFETVWTIGDDGLVHLRKLAPRLPPTIQKWYVDEYGGLTGIQQLAMKGSGTELVDIPVEKLVHFVNEQEGSDFTGVSVLRAAYKHWYYKDKFYIIDAIAKEKRSIGIDVGTLSGAVDDARMRDAESALMRAHGHEKMFMTEIEGEFTYRVEGIQGRLVDAMNSIEHHDSRILRSILAEFVALGERQSSSASQGMRRDNSGFFMMALGAIADEVIAATINEFLIKKWVDYNWNVKKYPTLMHSRLETRDTQQLAGAVARLVNVGALTADNPTENALREALELPEIAEDAPRPVAPPKTAPVDSPPAPQRNGKTPQEVNMVLDALRAVRVNQAATLAHVGHDIVSKGQFARIDDVNVPYRGQAAEAVKEVFLELGAEDRAAGLEARLLVDYVADRMKGAFTGLLRSRDDWSGDLYDPESVRRTLLESPVSTALIEEATSNATAA